MVTYFGGVL